jgi:hypothetical protein
MLRVYLIQFDSLPHILGIRGDVDFARLLESEQTLNRRHQLHSIVGGVRVVPEEFLVDPSESQNARPPAGSRIAQAGPIGDRQDAFHGSWNYDAICNPPPQTPRSA